VLHGVEGVGKTSVAAYAPAPVFLMARGETGLETLIDAGRLPEVPHLPEIMNWESTFQALEALRTLEHPFKTVVVDAVGGFERLCHEQVCDVSFGGDWSEKGFASYGKGPEVAISEWLSFLAGLDRIREERRCSIILLAHTKVKTFKNPEGPDFDRYTVDLNDKTWGVTHKWADIVLFANFYVEAVKERGAIRAKGRDDSQQRIMYAVRRAAFDAKNRHGLPETIEMGSSGAEAWANFLTALKAGRGAGMEGGAQ
jgi:hypothetical protein